MYAKSPFAASWKDRDRFTEAVMCGLQPRMIQVPLFFLGNGRYQVAFVRDGENDASVAIESGARTRDDSLTINLRAGSGFVGRFSRNWIT